MPSTVKYALSYPAGTTAPNVPVVMQTSMESVEAALNGIAAENMSKGIIARNSNAGTNYIANGTFVMFDLLAVPLIANRWYEVSYTFTHSVSATNVPLAVAVRSSATTDSTATGTDVDNNATLWTAPLADSGKTDTPVWQFKASATGTVNIKACIARAVGTGNVGIATRRLVVRDIGAQF
ncbi:hypothetical protein [Arthrobacter sp. B2a2-09]|uniref:hypothetical protein n=1 Tax=Arthrobacter sp. B2a2-09 TaxID=2952822 RepID=UPI0022CD83E8|nr:hypothetical protein [Arthrobacter sp. B2a2-09]MCZ9883723.1 hypothetical protein [Arthrobacter sp. B2a2-09]